MYWWKAHTAARGSADSPRLFPGWGWTGTVWPSWPSGRPRKAFWRLGRSCVALASCDHLSGWRLGRPHWRYPDWETCTRNGTDVCRAQRRTKRERAEKDFINALLRGVNESLLGKTACSTVGDSTGSSLFELKHAESSVRYFSQVQNIPDIPGSRGEGGWQL